MQNESRLKKNARQPVFRISKGRFAPEMLAQRPILEAAGVHFDKIANYEPAWKLEGRWSFGEEGPDEV